MNLVDKWMNSAVFAPEGNAPSPSATDAPAVSDVTSPAGGETTPSEATPSDTPDSSSSTFDGFGVEDFDEVEISEPASEPGPDVEPGAVAPLAPAATPPASPVVAAPPVPAAPAPATPDASKEGSPPPSEIATILEGMTANQKELSAWMAANAFALSKEEAEALELDASKAIPSLMARVHLESTKNTLNLINQIVPKLIAQGVEKVTGAKAKASEAIKEFYDTNTGLNEKDHGAAVTKWANAYRRTNPQASRKEAIEFVGRAVAAEFGVSPVGSATATRRAAPFAPARQGTRAPTVVDEQVSPFAGLGGDFDD
jgi:hypothetical protein